MWIDLTREQKVQILEQTILYYNSDKVNSISGGFPYISLVTINFSPSTIKSLKYGS